MAVPILHILGTSGVEGTSFARIVTCLARGLNRKYVLHALFLGGDGSLAKTFEREGISCVTIDPRGSALAPARLLKAVRDIRPAIVHQHAGGPRLTHAIRWVTGAKILMHVHGSVDEATMRDSDVIAPSGADLVIASSRYVASKISQMDCRVIYAGVDINASAREMSNREDMVIGTAGRLVRVKGHLYLIRAFAMLLSEFPHARLEICGDGPDRILLEDEARRLGCAHAVLFLGWRDDFPQICTCWDIFALPSLAESFPIALLEAMAMGLPAVASDVGGVRELLEPEMSGLLVRPSDAETLVGALRELFSNVGLRFRMGAAGHATARKRFSTKRMVEETESAYRVLASS